MPYPLHAPRINNNDDCVRVIRLIAKRGDRVRQGDVVAEIETDKSVSEVQAERDGYVLGGLCDVAQRGPGGGVRMWPGEGADEAVPDSPASAESPPSRGA